VTSLSTWPIRRAEATCHTPAVGARQAIALLVVALGACSGQPSTTPIDSPPATAAGPSGAGLQAFKDDLAALILPPADTDVLRNQLAEAIDLRGALGDAAEDILLLIADTERAAYPGPPEIQLPTAAANSTWDVAFSPSIPLPPAVPPPTYDVMVTLPGGLDGVGRPSGGSNTNRCDPSRGSETERRGGISVTVTLIGNCAVTITGSTVRLEVSRETTWNVAEDPSGAPVLAFSSSHSVIGEFDVCPTAEGDSIASLDQVLTFETTTHAGRLGRVGTHSTASVDTASDFRGRVDDSATLGAVTQNYHQDVQWIRTAAAGDGPEARHEGALDVTFNGIDAGVPGAQGAEPAPGDFSAVEGTFEISGDATQAMIAEAGVSAAFDFATMAPAFVAAEVLWRNSRCAMVAVPEYGAESELEVSLQGFVAHTQKVDKGSTTPFEARLKHRFGQTVTAPIEAELLGELELTPGSIEAPPGTLTYTAPDEDAEKATVKMTSTSKQGIGILAIAFDVGDVPGWSGTITLVEETQGEAGWSERHLTVHVRLQARPGEDDRFDDDGSTYEYEGSSHIGQELGRGCQIGWDWSSTGGGPFGEPETHIFLSTDPSSAGASLQIRVAYTTAGTMDAPCLGPVTSEPLVDDWWSPSCGTASRLFGATASDGRLDFSCTKPVPGRESEVGSGSLTVTGSLTRDDAGQGVTRAPLP
jgi:hypothetical protein